MCLIVAKIEKSYMRDDPNDVGFDMFVILIPFFVIFGVLCCCCTLLIYGAAPGSASDLHDAAPDEPDPENPPVQSEGPTDASSNLEAQSSPNDGKPASSENKDDAEAGEEVEGTSISQQQGEVDANMDDLD